MTPVPLLLVTDSNETCERIASALLSAPTVYRIERVASADLTRKGSSSEAMLALVDQGLEAAKSVQVVQELSGQGMVAVAIVDSSNVQALQEVVLAGATALLTVPFSDAQLWDTVGAALARGGRAAAPSAATPAARHELGTVIALYGPKSGTGTSLLAANTAISLQGRSHQTVVLAEIGEGPGSQAVILNLRAEHNLGDLLARYETGDHELINRVLASHSSGLRVLPAPSSPGIRIPVEFLEDLIDTLQQMFDFVVLDLQSNVHANALAAMRKANAALMVVVPEMTSLHHGRLFLEDLQMSAPEIQPNIVLNRSTMDGGVPSDAIRRHLRMQIAVEIPEEQAVATNSVNRGVPLVTCFPRSAITRSLQKLVRELGTDGGHTQAHGRPNASPAGKSLRHLVTRGAKA